MIVISGAQREILKTIFDSEVEVNEQALNLKKEVENVAIELRRIEEELDLKFDMYDWTDFDRQEVSDLLEVTYHRIYMIFDDKTKMLKDTKNQYQQTVKNLKKEIERYEENGEVIRDLQENLMRLSVELERSEKGMTSGMIEDYGINRKTFTDNIDSLVEENLIEESLTEKHGKQTWKYYKTTILGKVLFFKPMKIVKEEGGKMTIVDTPSVGTYFGKTDDETDGEEKYRMVILAFFYNYLERLKKFDLHEAQIQDTGVTWDLEIPSNILYNQLPNAMFDAFSFIDITKLDKYRELSTFWGYEGHYQDPEYGVSIMVPILPEAGFTPMSTIRPMTEYEMRYQREKREEKFPEPGPLGEKGWFVNISAYFRLDEWNPKTGEYEEGMIEKTRRKMFDFIEDVLTFNFLVNLKIITGNLEAASPATKKLFKDPDLNKFYNNMLNELIERSGSLDSYLKKYKI